ncbi:MAG: D-alanine--D-alanine ligase family protein [Erysipelotrichaceae bacterium]|nr:D-alanine--D-alanine ligase family protein [Erysipelotrichaceae bacterium]
MKICVAVFFGGKSTEHEISCISANQAIHAINAEKYDVLPVYISKDSEFYIGEELMDLANYSSFISNPESVLTKVKIYKGGPRVYVEPVKKSFISFTDNRRTIDVAFPVVHGTNVEDGSLAGFLQMMDLPYTSCDVLGGAVGQDKAVMKDIFKAEGIPMVDYMVVHAGDFIDNYKEYFEKAKKIGFPLIAKPANLGSSIGIEVIRTQKEFKEKVEECLKYDFKVVVEQMIEELKEVNISVIGSVDKNRVSAIEEVTNGFLDFDKKYQPGSGSKGAKGVKTGTKIPAKGPSKGMASTVRKVPADLSAVQKKTVEETAVKAFRALNSHGCVRIDFMIDNKTGEVYCNEINTIPGSLAFYLWKEVGMDFEEECEELIRNALNRYARRSKKTYSFDTNILDNYKK